MMFSVTEYVCTRHPTIINVVGSGNVDIDSSKHQKDLAMQERCEGAEGRWQKKPGLRIDVQ